MTTVKILFIVVLLIFFQNCAPSRFVKPLAKKENVISFSFGGPLIKFAGAPIPIPFSTLGYGYGITDKVTLFGNMHTTSLLFGNSQADFGATFSLYEKENNFGISVSPAIQLAYNFRNSTGARLWPSADINYYYHFNKKSSYLYAGVNTWIELSSKKAHNESQPHHILPNFQVGYTFIKTKWQHQFEIKYLGTGIANTPGVVDYIGISGKGAIGIYYSLMRKF